MNALVSIICPIYQEKEYIEQCIQSIMHQDYPAELIEFFLIDGMSTDGTREIVKDYCKKYPNIYLLDNPHKYVPQALNIGINQAKGEVIMRIDAHCTYPLNYISVLVHYLFKLNADNVGGLWNTLPTSKTSESYAIAISSSHFFGVGNSSHKVGSNKIVQVDTVPFGCYKKAVFDKIGLFDEDMIRNQDDEFNARLIKSGGKIYIIPEIVINYFARNSIKNMAYMYFQYGLFKPLVNKKVKAVISLRQLFPVFFLLGLIGGAMLSFVANIFFVIYISIIFVYLFIGAIIGIQNALKYKKPMLFCWLPFTFFITHISYGWGYLVGMYKLLFKSKFDIKNNR